MAPDDEFDFYPCLVDNADSSIYVNLRFEHRDPPVNHDTRYTIAVRMRERGEHGIGTPEEAAALNLVEEAVIATAASHGITYVGRLRTRGIWETVLYGPAGHLDALDSTAKERAGDRRLEARSTGDPAWTYYRDILLPDAERRQWMNDRRMVQILGDQGDRLVTPRRVDHRLTFPTPAARSAFVEAVASAGFTSSDDDAQPLTAHVSRVDPIELDHIHDVVMTLVDAALPHGGSYLRWEAGIEA